MTHRSIWIRLAAVGALVAAASAANASPLRWGLRHRGGGAFPGPFLSGDAVEAVLANTPAGGVARLPRGAFRVAVTIDRPMTLVADPLGTVLDASGLGVPAITIAAGVSEVSIVGVGVQRSDVDGILALGDNDRLRVRDVLVTSCYGGGIRAVSGISVSVDRSRVEWNSGNGLDLAVRAARVTRSAFAWNGGASVVLGGTDGRVDACSFEGGADGVRIAGPRSRVLRSSFAGVEWGVRFAAGADSSSVDRSRFRGGRCAVVADEGSTYCAATANRIAETAEDGIVLRGTWHTVASNVVARSGGAGVLGEGTSLRVRDNEIATTAADGVRVVGGGNMVDGNLVREAGGSAVSTNGVGNVVAKNRSFGAGEDAIEVEGPMNRVVSNEVEGGLLSGIVLRGDSNTVQGNVCARTTGAGIHVAGGAENLLVGNLIRQCGGNGFLDEGVGTTLDRNRID